MIKRQGVKAIRFINKLFYKKKSLSGKGHYDSLPSEIVKFFNQTRPLGPQKYLCYAPFKMMYFAFNGEVIACCHNRKKIMGRYPEQNIDQIWNGQEYNKLRDFIMHDDLSYGCDVCKYALISRNFDGAKNSLYDRYKIKNYPQVLEFELENRCNLECIICNPIFSSSLDKEGEYQNSVYDDNFIEQIKPFLKRAKETKFYGGEPFLISKYYDIWEYLIKKNKRAKILVQTNGTVLNDKVKNILERGRFSINISFDSFEKESFEKIRKNANFEKSIENLEYFHNYCKRKNTHLGIIPTPNRENVLQLADIVRHANKLKAKVYFNTLISPFELALWNLEKDKLAEIIEKLSAENLPYKTNIENDNYRHFQDFITQLKAWENEPNKENNGKIKISFAETQNDKEIFFQMLKNELNNNEKFLIKDVKNIYQELDPDSSETAFFTLMKSVPIEDILFELRKNDIENLKKIISKKIYEARNLYEIE